jgi:hypothetical protein
MAGDLRIGGRILPSGCPGRRRTTGPYHSCSRCPVTTPTPPAGGCASRRLSASKPAPTVLRSPTRTARADGGRTAGVSRRPTRPASTTSDSSAESSTGALSGYGTAPDRAVVAGVSNGAFSRSRAGTRGTAAQRRLARACPVVGRDGRALVRHRPVHGRPRPYGDTESSSRATVGDGVSDKQVVTWTLYGVGHPGRARRTTRPRTTRRRTSSTRPRRSAGSPGLCLSAPTPAA